MCMRPAHVPVSHVQAQPCEKPIPKMQTTTLKTELMTGSLGR